MPDPTDLLTSAKAWITILSTLTGGIVVRLWDTYLRGTRQDAELSRQIRDELRGMLEDERTERKALDKRVAKLEDRVDEERERRIVAERQNDVLQAKLDLVIRLLNDMREEEGLARLGEEELTILAMDSDADDPTSK